MNYTVAASEKSTVKITMTFDAAEWAAANDKAYLKNKNKYVVNGFRKGKVPKHVLINVYGKGVFFEDALNILFDENYGTVVEKEKENITVVGMPSLSVEKLTDEEVVVVAQTPVKPEVVISSYKGIKIKKYEYTVSDEDVENEVKKLQDRNARKVPVTDRACQMGDTVNIDFVGTLDGVEFEGGSAEGFDLTLGSGQFIPGFEDQVAGMNISDKKDIEVTFPEDYQAEDLKGKKAVFAVTLNAITGKELPEVTDEFVKNAAGCETIDEYKAKAKERLTRQAEMRGRDETENSIVEAISANATCEIPDAMLDGQIDQMVQRASYQLMQSGIQLDDYLKYTGKTMADFRAQYVEAARKNVLSQLVIEKIVKEESIVATNEEIEAKIAEQANSVEKDVETYKKGMDARQFDYIASDIVITKLFKFLSENNELYVD